MKDTYKSYVFVGIYILLIIMMANFSSAQLPGYIVSGDCVNIKIPLNATWVNVSSITYPNQTMLSLNVATSKIGNNFYYNGFCDTSQYGFYSYEFFDDTGFTSGNTFEVTKYGISNSLFMCVMIFVFILSLIAIISYIKSSINFNLEKSEKKCENMFEKGTPIKGIILSIIHSFMENYLVFAIVFGIIPIWSLHEIVSISGFTDLINIAFWILSIYFILVLLSTLYWFDCVFKFVKRMAEQAENELRGTY